MSHRIDNSDRVEAHIGDPPKMAEFLMAENKNKKTKYKPFMSSSYESQYMSQNWQSDKSKSGTDQALQQTL